MKEGALDDWNICPVETEPLLRGRRWRNVVSVKGECRTEGRVSVGERRLLGESQSWVAHAGVWIEVAVGLIDWTLCRVGRGSSKGGEGDMDRGGWWKERSLGDIGEKVISDGKWECSAKGMNDDGDG